MGENSIDNEETMSKLGIEVRGRMGPVNRDMHERVVGFLSPLGFGFYLLFDKLFLMHVGVWLSEFVFCNCGMNG